jgi:hypothetical protein
MDKETICFERGHHKPVIYPTEYCGRCLLVQLDRIEKMLKQLTQADERANFGQQVGKSEVQS